MHVVVIKVHDLYEWRWIYSKSANYKAYLNYWYHINISLSKRSNTIFISENRFRNFIIEHNVFGSSLGPVNINKLLMMCTVYYCKWYHDYYILLFGAAKKEI